MICLDKIVRKKLKFKKIWKIFKINKTEKIQIH